MKTKRKTTIRPARRRGAALLVAIVCVSIAVAVMCGIVRAAVQAYGEIDLAQRRTQAGWIAESAVDRAAAQLAADSRYRGEEWRPPAEPIGGRYEAAVRITVAAIEGRRSGQSASWRLSADCPTGRGDKRSRLNYRQIVQIIVAESVPRRRLIYVMIAGRWKVRKIAIERSFAFYSGEGWW